MQHLNHVINLALIEVDRFLASVWQLSSSMWPTLPTFNNFEKFLLLNAFLILFCIVIKIMMIFTPSKIWAFVNRIIFRLPFVKKKIDQELATLKREITNSFPEQCRSKLKTVPYSPVNLFEDKSEKESLQGFLSGSRYPEKKHSDFVLSLSKDFSYSNPLHYDLHPYVKQMEVQVIKMCANMMKFGMKDKEPIGGFFSGGTQSIIMAVLAYREYGYHEKGIKNPNLVICVSGHAAAIKGSDYFGVEIRRVKCDKQYKMDVKDMKSKMDSNTICVYTSYPNYPYGTVDDMEAIASICKKKDVPVHIDMCLGGFLVPFLKKQNNQPFFQVPQGVTSISMDTHKYGLSGKGASTLLFSDEKYRSGQLFVTSEWPGGLYGTPGLAGSRTGASIASAWISMMKMGVKGYTENALQVQNATKKLAKELTDLGFEVYGRPEICAVGFTHNGIPISSVQELMKKKKWDLALIQKPMGLHFSFTPLNSRKVDQMINDFRDTMKEIAKLKAQGNLPKQGAELELYGACAKISDGPTKQLIINVLLDSFIDI